MTKEHRRQHGDDESSANPAKERQEKRERVKKPAPDTIDEDQDDVAQEDDPFDTPR